MYFSELAWPGVRTKQPHAAAASVNAISTERNRVMGVSSCNAGGARGAADYLRGVTPKDEEESLLRRRIVPRDIEAREAQQEVDELERIETDTVHVLMAPDASLMR